MFEFNPLSGHVVDPSNGDRLVVTHSHWQSDFGTMAIFSANGDKKFEFTVRSRSIDEPGTWHEDAISRLILLDAREFRSDGRSEPIFDMHQDIDRLIEYRRTSAMAKANIVAFEFVDERKSKR